MKHIKLYEDFVNEASEFQGYKVGDDFYYVPSTAGQTRFYKSGKKPYLTEVEGYMTDQFVVSNWNNGNGSYPTRPEDVSCSAPTQSLLQKWLREKYTIMIAVTHKITKDVDDTPIIRYSYNGKNGE